MGGESADYLLGVGADTSKLHEGIGHANEDVEKFGEKTKETSEKSESFFSGISGGVAKLGLLSVATGGAAEAGEKLVDFFSESVKKSQEADAASAILGNTLKQNASDWDGNKEGLEEYVNKQKEMGFSTADVDQALGNLATTTHSVKESQNELGIAEDLARSKHISLTDASKLLQKADEDSTGALKKLGIEVDKNATKEQLLAAVHNATAGAAEAYSDTSAGAMDKLGAVFDTFQEKVGGAILPGITAGLGMLADFVSSDGFQGAITTVLGYVQTAFGWIGSAAQAAWPVIQPFANAILGLFGGLASGAPILQTIGGYFANLGGAIGNAWNIIAPALGGLVGNIISWIGANAPGILAQLATWAAAFGSWIWNTAIPALMQGLGGLISSLWGWITANGPGILAQLGTWAQAFWTWVTDTAWPGLVSALGGLVTNVWNWITTNGPGILQQLGTWAMAFIDWIGPMIPPFLGALGGFLLQFGGWLIGTALPAVVGKLAEWAGAFVAWIAPMIPPFLGKMGELLLQLGGWLIGTALPAIVSKLGEWAGAFINWIGTSVLPQLPGALGNIASAVWGWLTQTAKDLGSKLVNEWLPAFWTWITGPGGVISNIGGMLGQIASSLWGWISSTAGDIVNKALQIGGGLISGIKQGITNGWNQFISWIGDMVKGAVTGILGFLGIHSPSTVMAEKVGVPLVQGIQAGIASAWPALVGDLGSRTGGLAGVAAGGGGSSVRSGGAGVGAALARSGGGFGGSGSFAPTIVVHIDGVQQDPERVSVSLQGYAERTTPRNRVPV